MKNTSRRTFGKQLTGALVTLPAVSLAASQTVSAQSKQQPKQRRREEVKSSHNTPPDVVISDGSVIVESEDEFVEVGTTLKYKPKINQTGNPDITHIRVLIDNGDKIYEDLEAEGTTVVVEWQNNGGASKKALDIVNEAGAFTIISDKALTKKTVANKHRKNRLVHSDGDNFRIASVAVTNPDGFTTIFKAPGTKFESAEFRVLIWRH